MNKILLLFTFISCQHQMSDQSFENRFYLKWMAATNIEINKLWKDSGEWFLRPYNAEVLLAEISYLKHDSFQENKDCLFYKIPRRSVDDGHLSFYSIEADEECGKSQKIKVKVLDKISKLKMLYTFSEKVELASYGEVDRFHLLFQIEKNKNINNFITPLFNLRPDHRNIIHKKYSSSLSQGHSSGVMVHSMRLKGDKQDMLIKNSLQGEFKDSFLQKTLKHCQRFDLKCKEVISYDCSACRFGSYEVASVCPTKNDRVCGIQKCGQKNELACPRGNEHQVDKSKLGCVPGAKQGMCRKGLSPTCLEKKYLVCL